MQLENELLSTRASLLKRLKDWQDSSSWQDFFDTYWKVIYTVARKRGLTPTEAQDVVQETMISVAKQMPTFEYTRTGSFKAWLFNLTRWRIADQIRKRRKIPLCSSDGDPANVIEDVPDPAAKNMDLLWDIEWKQTLVETAAAKIRRRVDPRKYQIFDLCAKKRFPPEKVADRFGISVSQVYLTKHRVTQMIKVEIKRLEKNLV